MNKNNTNERFRRVWDRFTALDKTLNKSDQVFDAYQKSANEFRGALADQASRLIPREEYNTHHNVLVDKINSLDTRLLQITANEAGRNSGISRLGTIIIGGIGGIVGVITIASIMVTLFHQPGTPPETQAKFDQLNSLLKDHLKQGQ